MDEIYMRNNIYFFYLKENIENIEILYDKTGTLYNLTGQKIGNKYALYANKDYIFAPIDLLLYHVKSLEYLNKVKGK